MPRKLLLINAILIAMAAGSVVFIARQLMAPMPMPSSGRARSPAAGPATAAGTPGAQPVANQPLPGVIPPAGPPAVATPVQPPVQPGQPTLIPQPGQVNVPPVIPGRRPLPPNLLRRLPQVPPADAPQQ